jgi:hypothetical protein
MFKDYYGILEINQDASDEEIKAAFRRLAIKWHPDKNPGTDTTHKMQELNEAYVVLKDKEARERYNIEYERFKEYQRSKEKATTVSAESEKPKEKHFEYADYDIYDDVLKKWMANAERQAVELAKQTIEDLKGMVAAGVKEGSKAILYQIAGVVIVIFLFGLTRTCNDESSKQETISKNNQPTYVWFNNTIRWFSIKTPSKFTKQDIDYKKGIPGYSENINIIENYTFKSDKVAGTLLFMDTKFEAYIPEAGLRKAIENLLNTTAAYNLKLNCLDIQNEFDDMGCSGTFETSEIKGYVKGYCVWIDKKVYSVALLTEDNPANIQLLDSIYSSIKLLDPIADKQNDLGVKKSSEKASKTETGWDKIEIQGVGTIDLPPILEIQGEKFKKLKEERGKNFSSIVISEPKLVLQPKGVNDFDQNSLKRYARVILDFVDGNPGDFSRLTDKLQFNSQEFTELNNDFKQQLTDGFKGTELRMTKWYPVKIVEINGMQCININYERVLREEAPVVVNVYRFQNYDRMHSLTISYRASEKGYWDDTLNKVLKSFKITDIK